ncbi:MAG: hypothetical protein WA865_18730 [Spirulinaceae cyanobacterium]
MGKCDRSLLANAHLKQKQYRRAFEFAKLIPVLTIKMATLQRQYQ